MQAWDQVVIKENKDKELEKMIGWAGVIQQIIDGVATVKLDLAEFPIDIKTEHLTRLG